MAKAQRRGPAILLNPEREQALDILQATHWVLAASAFIYGLIWGSFANVVIVRLPANESVVRPPSSCRSCGKQIRWYENVPVLSWLVLRGRCSQCGSRISPVYPVTELLGGGLSLALWLHIIAYSGGAAGLELMTSLRIFVLQYWFLLGLLMLSAIDVRHFLLPRKLTLPLLVLGVLTSFAIPSGTFWAGYLPSPGPMESVLGAAFGVGSLWLVFVVYHALTGRAGIGGGDLMLLGGIGAWLGATSLPFVVFLASVQGVVGALVLAVAFRGRGTRSAEELGAVPVGADGNSTSSDGMLRRGIPFGPFLSLAAVEMFFFGDLLLAWFGIY